MNSLSKQEVAVSQRNLEARRQRIIEAIRRHLHQSDLPEERALALRCAEDDEATSALIGQLGIAQLRRECAELQDIDGALKRIAMGSYGVCSSCGNAIGSERMLAQAVASLCLSCQQDLERHRLAG